MENEKKLFSEKAETYLVCNNDEGTRAGQCLRRMLAPYVPKTRRIVECVNADFVKAQNGRCDYFRSAEPVVMHKGMTRFYDAIPERTAKAIRFELIRHFGSSTYYRLRNGQRLVTPDVLRFITTVCTNNGWNEELAFDEERVEFNW